MKKILCLSLLLSIFSSLAQPSFSLIPQPRNFTQLSHRTFALDTAKQLSIRYDVPDNWNEEQYALLVAPHKIEIRAKTLQGVVWARRTLEQLRNESGRYPHVQIEDWPEFPIRGLTYDDGRNFVGVEMIKHYLDIMSAYKLNLFHWHLTDKPAWRIECRCYPQLNDPRYQRAGRDQGAFYTYDQIREVIAYARERGIRILPEIDMPGHSDYFDAAFGFPMHSAEGRAVLEKCIAEFCAEIPATLCPEIHIGSDEVYIPNPKEFMQWAERTLRKEGRTTYVWDPGLPADSLSVRQVWRENTGAGETVWPHAPYVDSSMGYLNYYDPLLFPAKIFFHTPCETGKSDRFARGGILCMWYDVRVADKSKIELHNGLAGGTLAFAERFWTGGAITSQYYGTLLPPAESEEMRRFEAFQQRMATHKRSRLAQGMSYWEPLHAPAWEIALTSETKSCKVTAWGDVIDLEALCRKHGIPEGDVQCRAVRTIVCHQDEVRRFKIGFEAPVRSNRCSDGIAKQGHWPNEGRILINGKPLAPPQWKEPENYKFHFNTWAKPEEEFPYTDEQLYWMRPATAITLHKGVNKIEMSVKRHFRGQRFHMAFIEEAGQQLQTRCNR